MHIHFSLEIYLTTYYHITLNYGKIRMKIYVGVRYTDMCTLYRLAYLHRINTGGKFLGFDSIV